MQFIKRYSGFILLILVLLSFCLRFWWLDRAPRGLLIDEAHFGYISYSLIETGRDEHGISWPLVFKGFGDQKLPAQAYLLIPFIKFIGLNSVAVRLPSVMAGSLLVMAIYWLLREFELRRELALLGALIVVVNPWTFILSRFAYESNLALLFFTLGLTWLHKMTRRHSGWWVILSALMLSATWYTYIAYRLVTLLFSLTYLSFLLWRRAINWRSALLHIIFFVALITPLFHPQLAPSGVARFNQIGILSDEGLVMDINQNRTFCTAKLPKFICYGLWNKPLIYTKELLHRLVAVYSPQFLFTTGDTQLRYQSVEDYGQFYVVLLPLLFLGLVATLFRVGSLDESHQLRAFILLGLVITPLPSILAGQPQLVRLSPLVPFLILTMMLGLEALWQFLPRITWRRWMSEAVGTVILMSSLPFLVNFYTIHTVKHDQVYQSYLPELFEILDSYPQQITIYIKPFFSDPIMAYAYYRQVDPEHYQQNVQLGKVEGSGFQHAVGLGNFMVSEEPMVNLGCRAVKESQTAYYVTNEWFRDPQIPYLQRIASETGAIYYAYIYDAAEYASEHLELCFD